jgi:acyl-CoA hydrolase
MAHLVMPHHANLAGFAHGGELMKFMDNAATVVAVRHCHSSVVTAMVDELRFLTPVRVGNMVFLNARITFVSSTSMEIRVEVEVEDLGQETMTPAVTAYFVMVAVNETGKPSKVPPLILCTEREEQLFHEAGLRYRARKARPIVFEKD